MPFLGLIRELRSQERQANIEKHIKVQLTWSRNHWSHKELEALKWGLVEGF